MPYESQRVQFRDQQGLPPIILNLLIANIMMFILQQISNGMQSGDRVGLVELWLRLYPIGYGFFYPWQLITYGFLHGGLLHLFFNMFALWMFGQAVCHDLGQKRFAMLYFGCLLGAAACHLATQAILQLPPSPVLGASGATFGVLLAFGWRFPSVQIMLLIPPIPLKARTAVFLFGALELFFGISRLQSGIAHFAHLGGLATGLVLLAYWRGKLPFKPKQLLP